MDKKKRAKNQQTGRAQSEEPLRKVWSIFHFKERYELPDDIKICRKSSLHYIKLFVGISAGDEAVGYEQQMAMLYNGNGIEASMIEGLYGKLVRMAGKHSFARRGYLLDAAGEPLTISQIAKLLNFPQPTMRKWIKRFEEVKLLEWVNLPPLGNDSSEDGDTKKRRTQPENSDNSDSARSIPKRSGKSRAPLKERQTVKPPNGGKDKTKQRTTNGLTAVGERENKSGKAHRHNAKAPEQGKPKGQGKAEPPLPSEPHLSDEGGRVVQFARPPGSADLSKAGLGYGRRVYLALGYRYDIGSSEASREIASFASKHDQICSRLSGLSPPVVDGVLNRGLHEAGKIVKRKANRNKGAIWNSLMDKLATAKLGEGNPEVKHG